MPAHRYHRFGPYDYPEPPAGPAVHIQWPDRRGDPRRLDALVAAAREAGWPIYGAGLISIANPAWATMDALVILERGTDEDTLWAFAGEWLERQPEVSLSAVPRNGAEEYD